MAHVDVNGARLWVEEAGAGEAVLFLHGGLGDLRLWEPQVRALSPRFRCVSYDRRFWGRSEAPAEEFSPVEDAIGLLDALGVERAALVGLSMGGGLALDVAVAHPDRVWALAVVAGGVSGILVDPYTADQTSAFEAAELEGDVDTMMEIDFAVWAPLGVEEPMRDLWLVTPDARGVPGGARPAQLPPVHDRLDELRQPTLVVVARHDPPDQREVGAEIAQRIPGARLVEVDSDHYLTLREPDEVGELLLEFLTAAAPAEDG